MIVPGYCDGELGEIEIGALAERLTSLFLEVVGICRQLGMASLGHVAIDGTKRGDITESGRIWHYDEIRRSISTPVTMHSVQYR